MDQGTCKGCGAAIIWIKTPAGKATPVDRFPQKLWTYVEPYGWSLRDCYVSHFATCPNASKFRKPRGK